MPEPRARTKGSPTERPRSSVGDLLGGLLTVVIESAVVLALLAVAALMAIFIVWVA